ncbi:hypothetical protein [Modestobacter excelsi]|uniref:hypothetical protein n=1 Tax=Modestobacter excelsi TaxID=2213161 RepID=UPI00110CD3D5|nr:hypothetical protein [Modestobacter excelsi]
MRAGRLLGLALLLLGALAALSVVVLQPPAPAPVDAPAGESSAGWRSTTSSSSPLARTDPTGRLFLATSRTPQERR